MLSTLNTVDEFYTAQASTAKKVAKANQTLWNEIPKDGNFWKTFRETLPAFGDNITQAQYESATLSSEYVTAMASLQGVKTIDDLVPTAFLTPTEVLHNGLLAAPALSTHLMRNGVDQKTANLAGLNNLVRFSHTYTQDAGRTATGVYTFGTPGLTGYYRKLELPSCERCALLAGKWFRDNADFDRHPTCDCTSVPAADRDSEEESSYDPVEAIRSGDVHGLSEADKKAILEDGADVSQVINAKRGGLQKADLYGDSMRVTKESTTKRGTFYVPKTQRLRPDAIYKVAKNQDDARRLLTRYGYLA